MPVGRPGPYLLVELCGRQGGVPTRVTLADVPGVAKETAELEVGKVLLHLGKVCASRFDGTTMMG